jgi:hypothetical protein
MLGAPTKGITRQADDAAKNLKDNVGVDLTVGQMTHDIPTLQREARAFGFSGKIEQQQKKLQDFVYKKAGFNSTPLRSEFDAAKSAAGANIEKVISDAMPSYRIDPTEADTILKNRGLMDAVDHSGDTNIKDSLKWMKEQVASGAPLDAAEINKLRSDAWRLSVDPNINLPAKKAAIEFGNFFDGIIANRLNETGNLPALFAYKNARETYANFVLLDGAIRHSGHPSRMTFSPADLAIASHGVPAASDDLSRVIDDSVSYMLQHSPEQADMVRRHSSGLANALNNYGIASMASPMVANAQAAINAGSAFSKILHPLAMTKAGQAVMRNMAKDVGKPNLPLVAPAFTSAAGDYQQNYPIGRKRGGRVSSHDMAADQLVRAAERAKKGWGEETAPLLNQSDDAVVHALEVANRSI